MIKNGEAGFDKEKRLFSTLLLFCSLKAAKGKRERFSENLKKLKRSTLYTLRGVVIAVLGTFALNGIPWGWKRVLYASILCIAVFFIFDLSLFVIRKLHYKQKNIDTTNISGRTSDEVPDDCENYDHIETLVLAKLASILDVSMLKKDEQHGYYIIDSINNLWLEFGGSDVIIYYSKEHHHIMGMDFDTMDEWALEVVRFLRLIINQTVRFEYYFHGDKQVRIKIYSLHGGRNELIQHIRTTLNPLFLNSKNSRKEVELIDFQQQ